MDIPENQDNAGIDAIDITASGTDFTSTDESITASDSGDHQALGADDEKIGTDFNWPVPELLSNATTSREYSEPITEWDELGVTIALPADTAARTLNYGEQNPHGPDIVETPEGERWAEVISAGLNNGSFQDSLLDATRREGADWRQGVKSGDKVINIAQPRLAADDGPLVSGERAVLRVNALLGRGAIIQIPLWHSGFFITLKSPGEIDLLDTLQHISDNKIAFGRSTNGLAFANHVVVSQAAVLDLALRNLYEVSVQGFTTIEKIRASISALDIPLIAWGLACAIYPKGFQFERAVFDSKGVKTKVVRELLNIGTCLRTDQSSLNEWQIAHMAKRATGSMSESEVEIYRNHFTRGKQRSINLAPDVGLTLKVPNIDAYLNAGQRWIDELVFSVNQAFTQDLSEKQRNEMIIDRAKATSMRQYAHWVDSIDLPGQAVKGDANIERVLGSLSSDDTLRKRYYEIIQQYITDSVVSLIGVPQVHPEEAELARPRFENIIALDPVSVFFNLLYQRIRQIRQRP